MRERDESDEDFLQNVLAEKNKDETSTSSLVMREMGGFRVAHKLLSTGNIT